MMRLAFAVLLGLAGCVAAEEPEGARCGADGLQGLVGQDQSVLASMTLPERTRIIKPRQPITMDLSPGRLNIDLDQDGRIVRVWCG